MVLYCCHCLNVKVNTAYRTDKEKESDKLKKVESVFSNSSAFEATLGLGGITIEHTKLIFITFTKLHVIFRCGNCSIDVFAISNMDEEEVGPVLSESHRDHIVGRLKDQTGTVFLNTDCITGEDLKNVKSDKNYSEVFKVLISEDLSNKKSTNEVQNKLYQDHLMTLHTCVTDAFAIKQKELKEKVKKYEEQLMMELNQQQAKAHMDRQKLWTTVCYLNKDSVSSRSRSRSSSRRSEESTLSINESFMEPTPITSPPKIVAQQPVKKEGLNKMPLSLAQAAMAAQKKEKKEKKNDVNGSATKKNDLGIFGMDGFEDDDEPTEEIESEEEEIEEIEEDLVESNSNQPEMSIYSSSLPIAIPPRIAIVQTEETEENLPFEAPHQIAARTYTEDRTEILWERPNRRVGFSFGL